MSLSAAVTVARVRHLTAQRDRWSKLDQQVIKATPAANTHDGAPDRREMDGPLSFAVTPR